MDLNEIQKAYEKSVLKEVWRDFGPDTRKNRQFTKLLVKELMDALYAALNLEGADKIDKIRKAVKNGEKWLKS